MIDSTIASANDVYAFVAQLKTEAEKHGNIDFASQLDDAVHLGSSGLRILGAIRKTLIENHGRQNLSLVQMDIKKRRTSLPL